VSQRDKGREVVEKGEIEENVEQQKLKNASASTHAAKR